MKTLHSRIYEVCYCGLDLMSVFVVIIIIYTRGDVQEILNLQPKKAMAKPYQVKQVRALILRYRLGVIDEE